LDQPPPLPTLPPGSPRRLAWGCLAVPVVLLAVALALRANGTVIEFDEAESDTGPPWGPALFALGCTFFAARVRQSTFGGALADAPGPLVTLVRFVILMCGAIVPIVVSTSMESPWLLAAALVPLAAMVAWFPRRRA
jgi:hypothetical protein